jgi:hypothetical protein
MPESAVFPLKISRSSSDTLKDEAGTLPAGCASTTLATGGATCPVAAASHALWLRRSQQRRRRGCQTLQALTSSNHDPDGRLNPHLGTQHAVMPSVTGTPDMPCTSSIVCCADRQHRWCGHPADLCVLHCLASMRQFQTVSSAQDAP